MKAVRWIVRDTSTVRAAGLAKVDISTQTAELIVEDALQHIGEKAQVIAVCPNCFDEAFLVTLGKANNEVTFFLKGCDCEQYPTISGENVQGAVRRALLQLRKF